MRRRGSSAPHFCGAVWKRLTGYQTRSRIEAKMRCLKAFGERITSETQNAEIPIRIALVNRFPALGTAEIVIVVRRIRRKGKITPQPEVLQQRH